MRAYIHAFQGRPWNEECQVVAAGWSEGLLSSEKIRIQGEMKGCGNVQSAGARLKSRVRAITVGKRRKRSKNILRRSRRKYSRI